MRAKPSASMVHQIDCTAIVKTRAAAKEKFPAGWKTLKPYLRMVPQPK